MTFSYGRRRCSYILPLVDHSRVFMELGIPTQFADVLFDASSIEIVDPEKIVCSRLEILTEADVIDAVMYKAKLSGYICLTSILICISSLRETLYFISKIGEPVAIRGPYEAQIHMKEQLLATDIFSPAPISSTVTISGANNSPSISARIDGSGIIREYAVMSVYPGGIDKYTLIKCAGMVQFYNPKNLVVLDHILEDTLSDSSEYTLEIKFKPFRWFIEMLMMSISIDAEVKPGRQKSANK